MLPLAGAAACMTPVAQLCLQADVLDRGVAGYTTRHALQASPAVFNRSMLGNAQMISIWFGTNDARLKAGLTGKRGPGYVPLEEYQRNLQALVNISRKAGIKHILLVTPPPLWVPWLSLGWLKQDGSDMYEVT